MTATRAVADEATMGIVNSTWRRVDPVRDRGWRELANEAGDLFSSPRWLRVLADGYGLRFRGATVGEPGRPAGGVAWSEIDDRRGLRRISVPFSDFADPIGAVSADELGVLVEELAAGGAAVTFRLRAGEPPIGGVLGERGRLAWHAADLPAEEAELWSSLASGARQNIRKAERNDLTVTVGSSPAALFEFRTLHVRLRKEKYRMLAQPSRFFAAIASEFGPDDLRVVTACDGADPLASVVLLRHGDTAYYKFNASTAEALPKRANDLVMWTAMREAIAWGCTRFDFGVSDLDQPGLIRYKRKYASEEGAVVVLRTEPSGAAPTVLQRVLPHATQLLTRPTCPDRVTSKGGDLLYRFFC